MIKQLAPLISILVCPRDHLPLEQKGSFLVCPGGHDYPVVDGVPILLLADKEQTIGIAKASLASARLVAEGASQRIRGSPPRLGSVKPRKQASSNSQKVPARLSIR